MFDRLSELEAELEKLESQLSEIYASGDQAAARDAGRRHRRAQARRRGVPTRTAPPRPTSATSGSCSRPRTTPRCASTSAARSRPRKRSSPTLDARIRELLVPEDPDEGKNVIVEIRGGEGGEEANLWAADLFHMYERYADAHRWKTRGAQQPAVRHGRVPGDHLRGEGRRRLVAPQARGGPAPGAAGAGHREPGSGPHQRGDRRGAARGGGDRRRDRPERPRDRRVPLERSRRPVGEHHRLGGADHPQAHRPRRHLPGREEPAPEQGQGDADPAQPAPPGRAATARTRSWRRPAATR